MNIPHFKIAFIAGAIFFIAPTTSSAQTNDFQSQYENFKKQAKAEYEDFRAQCNAEYVEFVKEAWKEVQGPSCYSSSKRRDSFSCYQT